MAIGLVDVHPPMSGLQDAIRQGLVRCCPIRDGSEAVDRRTAALGLGKEGMETTFVSGRSRDVTLLARTPMVNVTDSEVQRMRDAGVTVVEEPVSEISVQGGRVAVRMSDGRDLRFDTPYPALGSTPRSELARALGARADDKGMLVADEHLRTSVTGLWSAGDVVSSLDQIGVAFGRAAAAAVDIHNALRERERSAESDIV